jgi:hypothetical protein
VAVYNISPWPYLLPPQGFGPRGPKPEEAYIEVPARNSNMISKYIYGIYQRQRNLSF